MCAPTLAAQTEQSRAGKLGAVNENCEILACFSEAMAAHTVLQCPAPVLAEAAGEQGLGEGSGRP